MFVSVSGADGQCAADQTVCNGCAEQQACGAYSCAEDWTGCSGSDCGWASPVSASAVPCADQSTIQYGVSSNQKSFSASGHQSLCGGSESSINQWRRQCRQSNGAHVFSSPSTLYKCTSSFIPGAILSRVAKSSAWKCWQTCSRIVSF